MHTSEIEKRVSGQMEGRGREKRNGRQRDRD